MLFVIGDVCWDTITLDFASKTKRYKKRVTKPGMAGNAVLAKAALNEMYSEIECPFTKLLCFSVFPSMKNLIFHETDLTTICNLYYGLKEHVVRDEYYETVRSIDNFSIPEGLSISRIADRLEEYPSCFELMLDFKGDPKKADICLVYNYGKTRGLINHLIRGFAKIPIDLFVIDGTDEGIRQIEEHIQKQWVPKQLQKGKREILVPSRLRGANGNDTPFDIPGDGDIHSFIMACIMAMSGDVDKALNTANRITRPIQHSLLGIRG